ncbi:MAG: thioredoxin [Alphaproteobacteria bacterium]|nr:thioredoxin [Alphaproteobacteria bacterium]
MQPILGQNPAARSDGAAAPAGDLIKESSTRTFVADVIEASRDVPVLVDFWAPWCGPCRQLTPILEKVVREAKGAIKLVKVNIDENQGIAQQLRIQSIPAVFAFRNGQPVDGFMGALPESQVRDFIKRLTAGSGPSPVDQLIAIAEQATEAADLGTAAQAYAQILQEEPQNPVALGGLARAYLASGDADRAKQTLALVPPEHQGHEAVAAVQAQLKLAEMADKAGDSVALLAKIEADPNDHQARLDLATALVAQGKTEAAIAELLESIRRDRNWSEAAARKQLLTLFEALGPTDPAVQNGRRRLSSILFS